MFTLLLSIGWQGVTQLRQLNRKMQEVTGEVCSNEQTVNEVFRLSNSNSRITLSIFLTDDAEAINRLVLQRADNTRRITELISGLKARAGTEEEKRLLAALEAARKSYIESY